MEKLWTNQASWLSPPFSRHFLSKGCAHAFLCCPSEQGLWTRMYMQTSNHICGTLISCVTFTTK